MVLPSWGLCWYFYYSNGAMFLITATVVTYVFYNHSCTPYIVLCFAPGPNWSILECNSAGVALGLGKPSCRAGLKPLYSQTDKDSFHMHELSRQIWCVHEFPSNIHLPTLKPWLKVLILTMWWRNCYTSPVIMDVSTFQWMFPLQLLLWCAGHTMLSPCIVWHV